MGSFWSRPPEPAPHHTGTPPTTLYYIVGPQYQSVPVETLPYNEVRQALSTAAALEEQEANALGDEVVRLRASAVELELRQQALRWAAGAKRARLLCYIHSLPVELLSLIFHFACADSELVLSGEYRSSWGRELTALALSQVHQNWRQIARVHSRLWAASIRYEMDSVRHFCASLQANGVEDPWTAPSYEALHTMLDHYLSLSGSHPFDISLRLDAHHPHHHDLVHSHEYKYIIPMLGCLVETCRRWRHLHIVDQMAGTLPLYEDSPGPLRFDNLESVTLDPTFFEVGSSISGMFACAPRLSHWEGPVELGDFPYWKLERLTIREECHRRRPGYVLLPDLLWTMRRCLHLRHLRAYLDSWGYYSQQPRHLHREGDMITMHALQDLEIGFCLPEQIPYFFNHVDAPILSNLSLRGNGDGSGDVLFLNTWPHGQFKDFLSRLSYPLTSLSLIDINLQSSDLQKILTHLPALVSLAVQHTHISYDRHNTLPLYATFNAMAASPHSTAALLPRLTSLSLHGRMKIDFQLLAYMVKSRRRSPHIPLKDLDLVLLKGSSVMDEATKGRLEAACHLTYQRRDSL